MIMHPVEIQEVLKTLKILVDTREQPTASYYKRLTAMGLPTERRKLDFGDYSACVDLPDGKEFSLEKMICIERKMGLDEICSCYCQSRKRFTKEFERAKAAKAKIYLLIENATWEKIFMGDYRSRMNPSALTASLFAWLSRYNCQILFCKPNWTGRIIKEILYREIKEKLENDF